MSLSPAQQTFADQFALDTGLHLTVVESWVQAEEQRREAGEREKAGDNDWLNVGMTDSGPAHVTGERSIWDNPRTAALATAEWLRGQGPIAVSYGRPTRGVAAILESVGESAKQQIAAIRRSGWASSGYPELGEVYAEYARRLPTLPKRYQR